MKKIVLILLLINLSSAQAFDGVAFFKERFKIVEQSILDFVSKYKKPKIQMPPIPEVEQDATSTAMVDSSKEKNILTPEQDEKFNYLFLNEMILATRGNKANDNELAKWMNVMGQGASREGVYRAFVLDDMYGGLENFDSPINDSIIKFSEMFMGKYLNKTTKPNSFEAINFYTLKRVVVEKTLDLVDYYLMHNPEHLYDWYAIFSTELAQNYPKVWNGEIRGKIDAQIHRNWAKQVPSQHIKSEIIIKLHLVYNFLRG